MRTDLTIEQFISRSLSVQWETAHTLAKPDYWHGVLHHIDGLQSALFTLHDDSGTTDELQFLWSVALQRRSMAYEDEANSYPG